MSRFIILILLSALCITPLIHAQDDSCSPLVPRLAIGGRASVISACGINLRAEAAKNGAMLGPLANGVEIDVLTDSFARQEYTNYDDYLLDIQAQVNAMPPEAFSPRIETLDTVIESLRIDPDTLVDSLQDP